MRNQPCYLTTGGGHRPESLPTLWSRATTPLRRLGRTLDTPATPRFLAAATAVALVLAVTLMTVLVHLASTPRAASTLLTPPPLTRFDAAPRLGSPTGPELTRGASSSPTPEADTAGQPALATASSAGSSAGSSTAMTASEAARLAVRTIPGLVNITTRLPDGSGEAGTGIVVRGSGLVLTAAHVVAGAVTLHAVDLGDGQDYPATVIGADRRHDIALIQLNGASGLTTAHLATAATTTVLGEQVESVGNAYGRGYPTLGTGPITALDQTITDPADPGRRIRGLIAANNSILPGQSGGPMLNRAAQVIGVNDAYQLTTTAGTATGVGYAIRINVAVAAARTLLAHHNHQTRPRLVPAHSRQTRSPRAS